MSPQNNSDIRKAIRTFQYGLHIVTAGQGAAAHAATISWVTQVSFQPRRIAIAVRKDSHIYPVLKEQGAFALNVVGEDQESLASTFFKYVEPSDTAFENHPFESGPGTGAPLLLEAPAWLECRIAEEANVLGDHALLVADVLDGQVRHANIKPLNLATTNWSYGG